MRRILLALVVLMCLLALQAYARDTVYYYYTDALHSAVVETDSNGAVLERTNYGPYGQVLNRSMRDGPGYTGHQEDPGTGLVYMQQRYYDSESGRFLSTDPVQADGNGGRFNRYDYANDNPYRYMDPNGRKSQDTMDSEAAHTCTGSHIGGGACGSLNLRMVQLGSPSVSEMKAATAQQNQNTASSTGNNSSTPQGIRNAAGKAIRWIRNRTSATAEAAAAFGPGIEGQATKQIGSAPDSVSGSFVVGEGAYVGVTGNFQVFSWGQETLAGTAGKLVVNPTSYVRIKLGAGLSLGVNVDLYPHGGVFSVSVGPGFGEQAIVKPPATISLEQNFSH